MKYDDEKKRIEELHARLDAIEGGKKTSEQRANNKESVLTIGAIGALLLAAWVVILSSLAILMRFLGGAP